MTLMLFLGDNYTEILLSNRYYRAENISLKSKANTLIIFLEDELSMVHFLFCLKNGFENFENWG